MWRQGWRFSDTVRVGLEDLDLHRTRFIPLKSDAHHVKHSEEPRDALPLPVYLRASIPFYHDSVWNLFDRTLSPFWEANEGVGARET